MSDSNSTIKFCKKCQAETEHGTRCNCKPCDKVRNSAWRAANPEKSKAATAAWRSANPELAKATNAAWRAANPERQKASEVAWSTANPGRNKAACAAWKQANSESVKEYNADWRAANPEALKIYHQNRRALKKALGGRLSNGLAEKLFKLQKGMCPCCAQPLGDNYHLDHRMPLALGGAHADENMQLLRSTCNQQKHAKHPIEFMQSRGFLL